MEGYPGCVVLVDLLTKRDFVWMHRSTGLSAIFYSLRRFPNVQKVIMGGIGFKAGGHFNGVGEFTGKTEAADRITIPHWPESAKLKIETTDKAASELAGLKFWEGEVFYHK